ncbi:hypothetical protein Q4Q35_04020 [Flavivirga aquimarina]|uniref:Baseplate protein J-like domain-containing protein n=1 Tax=Flavivirga aquimarina TaxID=2027862 RepID=A0ABT8W767_9FLAO|nr:hypothetical protein [Flavivirga aquimarina]MDO5968965.1 hypothetical protein [Flavivirga aquimarina]
MIERRTGTIQSQRINDDLLNQKFKIDDRSFEDLLGYMISYLGHINFYNIDNTLDGNWQAFIRNASVMSMVKIIKEPLDSLIVSETPLDTMNTLLDWYAKIEEWHINLTHLKEDVLASKIGNILFDILKPKKETILNAVTSLKQEQEGTSPRMLGAPNPDNPDRTALEEDNKNAAVNLDQTVNTFKELIIHIQDFTKNYLKAYLFARNDHAPNNAMYITFALLYKKIQEELNKLSQSHLDFYYKDILQQTLRKGKPTQAIICFNVDPKIKNVFIPQGTLFSAGKLFESKKAILFETDKPVVVSPIVLESAQTLFFNKNPFIEIGTDGTIISNIIKNNLVNKGKKIEDAENWSLFGANKNTLINSGITKKTITNIGFMIGSPVLFLEEGKRQVTITFRFEEDTSKNVFWKLVNQIVINDKMSLDTVFNMVFENTFIISYTSTKGWEAITSYNLVFDETTNDFGISFILENTAPPLTTLITEEKNSAWPMVRVLFDEYAPIYAYSFFKGVNLESVTIDVKVTGVKNLSVYNNIGKMPLTKSFDLFGPLPSVGDYLMVGKSELFKKELISLNIHIDWANAPEDYGGFDTYYQEYDEVFTNDSFKIEVRALSNGYWFPEAGHPLEKLNLYSTEPCTTPEGYDSVILSKDRSIALSDLEPYKLSRDYRLQDPIKYDIHTQNGFLKLTLSNPQHAFGQKAYQKSYTKIVTYNARNKEDAPLPNKPFIPKVKEVQLDYTAKDVIYFDNTAPNDESSGKITGDYMHITPSGIRKVVDDTQVFLNTMVTDYEGEGYLYVELSGVQPNSNITLFFDLLNDNPLHNEKSNNIVYQYKASGSWVTLTEKYIISDSTYQFTKSGIVELQLPDYAQINEDKICELRFMAIHDAYVYPVINGIYPNALMATCTSEDNQVIGKCIEAKQITKSVVKIAGLKQIMQPAASFGGETPGTPELFYTEVSERLRHKDRAVSLWDYEHLILQYFHDVIAAKCTNLDKNFKSQAGKVTLVVLSKQWTYQNHQYFNTNDLIKMTQFLQRRANSFIKIKVQNPVIEWLLVNCVVEFYVEDDSGYYMTELNTVINDYLSPLSKISTSRTKGIGTEIVPIMLMSHIENLPYIKSVRRLDIEHIVEDGLNDFTMKIHEKNNEIKPTTPWSILAPKLKHNIFLPSILEEGTIVEIETQNLQIGVDYIIAANDVLIEPEGGDEPPTTEQVTEDKTKQEDTKASKPKLNTILTFKTE